MRIATMIAGAVVALGMTAATGPAAAAPFLPEIAAQQSLIEPFRHWRGHRWGGWNRCRAVRRECAYRWGWGGRKFHRCVWRRGC